MNDLSVINKRKMAAESNMGFDHPDPILGASAFRTHKIGFKSGAVNSTSDPTNSFTNLGNSTIGDIMWGGSGGGGTYASVINNNYGGGGNIIPSPNSVYDSVPGVKQETGLAVEWSLEEQSKLKDGLVKYAQEPNIMRYIKIAAKLRDKTVRDVALRCRWMRNENGKRRKQDYPLGRKIKDKKETLVDSSAKANRSLIPPQTMSTYSVLMHPMNPNDQVSSEALIGTTRHLIDDNAKVFSQIAANLANFRIHDNVDLLSRTRHNLTTILQDMKSMPGIMSQMPPLPISIDEELADTILPTTSQAMMFGLHSEISLKQEPRC